MTDRRHDQRLIGESAAITVLMDQVSRVAPLDRPVLVVGERGTGKELVAARIHFLSRRWERAYLQTNCAAISDSLLESELFGHEAGAFTGAARRHIGRFERADGGSLFLDELANTSMRVQEQLLRVIEYGEFDRLGGRETLNVDVRLIAATNEDLPSLAAAGDFRHDLLDRLSFDVITLPPLRERREDIALLAEHFANNMTSILGRDYFAGFSPEAQLALLNYRWPGNVRELKNVVERSLYRLEQWEEPLVDIVFDPFESPWRPGDRRRVGESMTHSPAPVRPSTQQLLPVDLKAILRSREAELIAQAMEQARFNQKHAATLLGLSYHQLRAALRRQGAHAK